MSKLSIALIGAGAVGCYYAGHFSRAGASVTILTRTPDAYDGPIRIDSKTDPFEFVPDHVCSFQDPRQPFDVVILATKVLPEIDPVSLIRPIISAKTIIVMIQNGLFIENDLISEFSNPIIRGLAFVCVSRVSKSVVRHLDFGPITLGLIQGQLLSDHPFISLCHSLRINVIFSDDIQRVIWEKLIWNAAFNPLSVYYDGATTDMLLANTESFKQIMGIMKEVQLGAAAAGIVISDDFIDQRLEQTKQMIPYKTSMCLDFEFGRPLELTAILGNFIAFCDQYSLDVPFSKAVYKALSLL